jgi:anti-sigma B factor antagonist
MIRESTLSELGIKERRVGNVTVLDADGRLRIALRFGRSSVTLGDAIVALLANGQREILLNLAGVNMVGAKELGDLVSTYVETKRRGGQFKLFNLTPTARQLMLSTKLSSVLDLYESEAQAIESFESKATLEIGVSQI